jgi:hypothetical protein
LAEASLCTAQEEAEQLLRERYEAARHGCRACAPFLRWKDCSDNDDTEGNNGAAGAGHAYEVTDRYKLV